MPGVTTLTAANKPREAGPKRLHGSRLTLVMVLSFALCAALFSLFPGIDLFVSGLFYTAVDGFAGERDTLIQAIYKGVPLMSRAVILALLIALFAYAFQRGEVGRRRRLQVSYLVVSLALGPGLLIDVALKDNWGRARPAKVTEFGGQSSFSPALAPSDQCHDNCSFVSGHASAGFYLVSLGFLGGAAARRRWTLVGLAAGALFGFGRITQGGHFLSDVVFSFYATWFAAWASWLLFRRFGWLPDEPPPPALS